MEAESKKLNFGTSLFIVILLAIIMAVGLAYFKISTQTVFMLAIVSVALVAIAKGFKMSEIEEYFIEGCKKSMLIVAILMIVGAIIGTWIISGIVPSIIYYGLTVLSPAYFLVLGFFICCIVSFFTGSSYTSLGTLGIAFMGVGYGLGINPGLTAGMVVSGSVFGDKMSPFSDTTNLAPASAGTDIFSHIRSMMYTTVPSLVISAILYLVLGLKYGDAAMDLSKIKEISDSLLQHFTISPILLLVPIITIGLAIKKIPPLISLLIGAFAGVIAAFIFQGQYYGITEIMNSMATGFKLDSGVPVVDKLLNRGGISSMMSTVSLALLALGFGEILQRTGVLSAILNKAKAVTSSSRTLVIGALITCLVTNMLTASQYMAIILPGELFQEAFRKAKIKLHVLSRTLEDGGTIFAFLVPWSMAAIYTTGVIGVPTMQYLPYAFLCLLCPIFAVIYALTGFAIFKETDNDTFKETDNKTK